MMTPEEKEELTVELRRMVDDAIRYSKGNPYKQPTFTLRTWWTMHRPHLHWGPCQEDE